MKNNKNMKKLLSLVLTLVMVLSLLPAMSLTASAATYTASDAGKYITLYNAGDILMPGHTISYGNFLLYPSLADAQNDTRLLGRNQGTNSYTLPSSLGNVDASCGWIYASWVGTNLCLYPAPLGFNVNITARSNMTLATGSTSFTKVTASQTFATYTAAEGYAFHTGYPYTVNGVKAAASSDLKTLTISGKPTANATLTLPAATRITRKVSVGLDSTTLETAIGSGDLTQNAVDYNTAMTDVVVQTKAGYHFPADYAVDTIQGISVTRNSDTQVTVSGTPTCAAFGTVTLTLPAATPNEYTMTIAKNSKIQSVAVTTGGSAKIVGDDGTGTYTVTYNTAITVTATAVESSGDNQYSFYRWINGTTTKSNTAEYTFTWNTADNMTLTAEGVGGLVAVGKISVASANLQDDKTATVTLDGTPGDAHSVSLVKDSTTIALTNGGIGNSYTASLPAGDTTEYEVWVDGIKTTNTVKGGNSATVKMAAFDCAIQKDGEEWTEGNDHVVALRHNGIVYPSGSVLPEGVSYERLVDGVAYGDTLTTNTTTDFYTVTFNDGTTDYGDTTPFKPQVILYGGKVTAPTAKPVKAGYTFIGWKVKSDDSSPSPMFHFTNNVIEAKTTLVASWQSNKLCEARWVKNGETFYGTLTEALANTNSGEHIYVQTGATLTEAAELKSGVTLELDTAGLTINNSGTFTNNGTIINNGSITGNITNNGTITNTVVSGVDPSGELGTITNSGSVTGGTLGSLTNTAGMVKNAAITGSTSNTGTLDGCRIGSGTDIGGTIKGSTYAADGVTFDTGATFEGATVSLQGGGNEGAGMNSATVFAGLMDIDNAGNNRLKANVVFRSPVTFDRGGALNLGGHSILGANGSDGAYGNDGITPIKVTGDYVFTVNGPGSIIGGNGGDATSTGSGGCGGNGVEASASASVIIGEGVCVSGGNGGTGNGESMTGGNGGDGVKGSTDNNDYVRVAGTAEGGNGGPAINGATGGAGGSGVNAAIVYDGGGTLTGGQPGNGRFGDPLNPDTSGGVSSETVGEGQTAAFTWVVDFSTTRMSATNSTHPNNQIVPDAARGSYSSILSINPAGNQYISAPDTITVKMGTKTLTAGADKDYTYDKDTGAFVLCLGNADITDNISVTANGVVPNEVDIAAVEGNPDTAKQLKDALEAGIKRINIKENVTLPESATVPENSVVYVDAEKTLTVTGDELTVIGAVVVNGTFVGSETVAPGGALLETPVGVWSSSSNSDYITGLKGSTTYKSGSIIATTDTGKLYIRNEWIGKEIKLAQYDSLRGLSSPEQTINLTAVPEKPAAPAASKFKVTQPDSADATGLIECLPETVTDTAINYQYSTDNGKVWNSITSGNALPAIPQGTDVFIRFPADSTTTPAISASQILIVHISTYTPPAPYNPGGSSSKVVTAKIPVIVDGVEYNIGTAKTENGVTTVTIDQTELQTQLDAAKETVIVPVTPGSGANTVTAQFIVANVDEMAEKEMTLSVQVDDVSYDMRAIAIDTEKLLTELGAADPADVPVNVTITELSEDDVTLENGELVLPPVSFTVTAGYSGKSVEVEVFEKYVQRVIEVPNGIDASKITTAVVVENGKQRHVPTEVFQKDGKWYARINSLTNSTYALIHNEVNFTDDDGMWFENVVTEMASRGIITGRGEGIFDGNANITRTEFAAILVRALGLPENGDASAFTDVAESAWYYGAVGKAYEYGLINGRSESIFDPDVNITRQEAMAMVHRAAAITELAGTAGTLADFSDADSIEAWALNDAQWNVGSGLIQGNSAGMICGKENITRGETATIILRLLQKSELVDVRTNA